jgi:hypothetical protein
MGPGSWSVGLPVETTVKPVASFSSQVWTERMFLSIQVRATSTRLTSTLRLMAGVQPAASGSALVLAGGRGVASLGVACCTSD